MSRDEQLLVSVKNLTYQWNETYFRLSEDTAILDRKNWNHLKDSILEIMELVWEIEWERKNEPR